MPGARRLFSSILRPVPVGWDMVGMTTAPMSARRVTIILPHRESFSPTSAGAVAMAVQRLAAGPSRYQAKVIGPPPAGEPFPDIDFCPVRVPRLLPLSVTQRYAARLALTLAGQKPGLIEVHNKPDVALWLARCFPNRPVTLFLHNDPRSMRGAQSPHARTRLLRRLARVITVSDYLRRALLEGVSVPPDRPPLVIHNSLDFSLVPAPLPPAEREKIILFAGRVVPDKAPDVFVSACSLALPQLPGWRAEIIGADGFAPGQPDSDFIRLLRPRAAAEVLAAMARAAIVVVPSRWEEPFGMTALEAMACGAALACSGRGGLAEVAGDTSVPINPDDLESVASALLRLAENGGLRAELSAAGQARARTHFSAAHAIATLDAIRDRDIVAGVQSVGM